MTDSAAPLNPAPGKPSTPYWLALIALFVLVVGSYWPSMRGEFLWDDDFYVTNNTALKRPDGIERIWLHNPKGGFLKPRDYPVPQFYPMTHTSFWVQTRGHDWSMPLPSWPFHLVNVLLHFANAWMLWTILRRLGMPGAFVAAAIWALHPVQVESVAWITERKNVLSAFFMFGSVLVYLRFAGLDLAAEKSARSAISLPPERWKLYALALVLFICSILSKSVTGSMPAVILLLIWWKRAKIKSDDVLPLLPFFALAIGMGFVTSYFEHTVVGAQGQEWKFGIGQRLLIAGGAVWFYALKVFAPVKLAFIYRRWVLHEWWLPVALGAAVALVVGLFAVRQRIGRGPLVMVLIFAGTLFPALGFINVLPMRYSFVADHFQYVACAALIAGTVWCLHRFFTTPQRFTVASALILGALTAISWSQNHVYKDAWTLWSDTLNKNPEAWMAHNNLGVLERDSGMLTEAERHFRRALELKPDNVEAVMNLGVVQQKRGDPEGAIELLKSAAEIAESDPVHGAAYAHVYYHLGEVYRQKGDVKSALAAFYTAAEMDRHNVDAINAVGGVLKDTGRLDNAKIWFLRALELDPDYLQAHTNLGNVAVAQGDVETATKEFQFVLVRDHKNYGALMGAGRLFAGLEQWEAAVRMFTSARQAEPNSDEAIKLLSAAIRHLQATTRPATTRATTQPSG